MQNERRWELHAVLFLGSGLMVSWSLGMIAAVVLRQVAPSLSLAEQRFSTFLISSVAFQGAGLVLTHFFIREHDLSWANFLGLKKPNLRRALLFGVITAAIVLPGLLLLNKICEALLTLMQGKPELQSSIQILQVSVSPGQRICFGIAALVLAPFVEEILFRGILYRFLKQMGWPRLSIVISSLLFGFIHGNLMALVPLSCLAVVLALLYDETDNLMSPITAHAVFNAVNFFMFLSK